jgi:DNA polymerase sigma
MADFEALSTQIEDIVICNACSERDLEDCQQVVRRVEIILNSLGIHGEVVSHGSAGTSLWTREAALDLTVLTEAESALEVIYSGLLDSIFARNLGWRQRGNVQTVTYLDSVTGVEVWLSVNDEVGLSARRLMRQFISQDERFYFLASLVKRWARAKHICKPDSYFSGYVWTLLVLHFLMQLRPPVTPT